ncbi:unnamed protein product [Boreogadus saida]
MTQCKSQCMAEHRNVQRDRAGKHTHSTAFDCDWTDVETYQRKKKITNQANLWFLVSVKLPPHHPPPPPPLPSLTALTLASRSERPRKSNQTLKSNRHNTAPVW